MIYCINELKISFGKGKILFDNDTITKQDIIKKFTSKLDDKTQKLLAQQDENTIIL